MGTHLSALSERAAGRHVPLQAQIELTGRCHMDCVHCYLDIRKPPKGELSTTEVIDVMDQLRDAGTLFLTFTGGEIFLRKDIFELMAAARERSFAYRLYTSGTLLDRDKIKRIAELEPLSVEISVYGMRSLIHDGITRRKGSLRKSLRAASLLRKAGVPVTIKSPLIAGNEDGHFDLIDAARRLDCGWVIDPSLISRRDGSTEPLRSRPTVDTVARLFADPRVNRHQGSPLPPPRRPDEAPCAIARRVVRIGPTGEVYACSVFPISAGNVRDTPFRDIWSGSAVLQKIRGINAGDLRGECGSCSRSGYCGRCSSQALLEYGDFQGPSLEACERAEAREKAAGVAPPPGAHRMGSRPPLGPRPLTRESFVPLTDLHRRRADTHTV